MPATDMPTYPIRIQHCDLHLINLQTRMPFKYGIATMTRVPQIFVRVRAEIEGALATGIASDLLPPKWFTKDPNKPVDDEILEMIRVIRHAAEASLGLSGQNAFQVWRQLYERQQAWGDGEKLPSLLAHFGTSLIERALIEAVGRASHQPLAEMQRTNRLGVQLGEIHPSLQRASPSDFLPKEPLPQITLRHTVGLVDPLRDEDIPGESRLQDGLPQSFQACIQAYGLRHFKIKVTGKLDQDLGRLEQIARIIQETASSEFRFSLDGNEQFHSVGAFREFWETISRQTHLQPFLGHLLFVEQPLHRDDALQPAVAEFFSSWPDRPPVIIDESDATLESLPAALKLGYAGTSHKNCKGIFKGIANRCLLLQQAREQPQSIRLMSGEDLGTIGPVSVIQDLAAMAALGISSVERNGHHYFAGLSMFSSEIQRQVLAAHGDLYQLSSLGWPTFRIKDGNIQVDSLNKHPFGVGFVVDVEQFTPVDKFQSSR
jgi:L-alanine-DL-glutamate epimerase-like enolase superfamily enzyme